MKSLNKFIYICLSWKYKCSPFVLPVKPSYIVILFFNFWSSFDILYILAFFKTQLQLNGSIKGVPFKNSSGEFLNLNKLFIIDLCCSLLIFFALLIKLKVKLSKSLIALTISLSLITSK